jgi:hypothetical protein
MMKSQIMVLLVTGVLLLGCEMKPSSEPTGEAGQNSQQTEPELVEGLAEVPSTEEPQAEAKEEPGPRTIQVTLKDSDEYEFPTGMGGDEQGARVSKEPAHAAKSEMVRDLSTNFEPVYRYRPEPGYVGTDQVEITLIDIEIGGGPDEFKTTKTTVVIELEIVAE